MQTDQRRASPGYYSLLQYCPDFGRDERANVGVFLYCPERGFQRAKVTSNHQRIARFFKRDSFNKAEVEFAERAMEVRLSRETFTSVEDLRSFAARRGNAVQLGDPRSVRVVNPEEDLERLFIELVGKQPRSTSRLSIPALDDVFTRMAAYPGVQENVTFEVPVLRTQVRARYAFQNGALNLVRPERISNEEPKAMRSALMLAAEGDLIRRHRLRTQQQARLIVVESSGPQVSQSDSRRHIAKLFDEYQVRFVPHEEIPAFARQVEEEIRSHN